MEGGRGEGDSQTSSRKFSVDGTHLQGLQQGQ